MQVKYFANLFQMFPFFLIMSNHERFVFNAFNLSFYSTGAEISSIKNRAKTGIIIHMYFTFGFFIITLLAYFIRNWKLIHLLASLSSIPTGLLYICYYLNHNLLLLSFALLFLFHSEQYAYLESWTT